MKSVPDSTALNNVRLPEFPVWHQKILDNNADYFRSLNGAQMQPAVDYRCATPAHVAVAVSSSPAVINAAIDGQWRCSMAMPARHMRCNTFPSDACRPHVRN
jgi:hypothetical protein